MNVWTFLIHPQTMCLRKTNQLLQNLKVKYDKITNYNITFSECILIDLMFCFLLFSLLFIHNSEIYDFVYQKPIDKKDHHAFFFFLDNSDSSQVELVAASSSSLPGPRRPIQKDEQANKERGRKRKKNEDTWKKRKRQNLRNSGLAYHSVKGKEISKKCFTNAPCHCKKNCNQKFTEEERKRIFESFWKLGDFSKQNVYIRSSVMSHRVKRKRIRDGSGSEKNVSYSYILRDGANSQTVCKKYFLETLQLSHGRVYRCISKPEVHAVIDSRGKKAPSNRLDDSDIVAHIKSFPAYQSHYSRKKIRKGSIFTLI